ncbi:Long-chain-fatty-acid--CoA ligase [Tsuneonella dongtanensis]|uniref:3-methylmercaptopropionyl-CoA ligase n=1 Tax=Tsuneonella dongtanensis TaxID=692370 RepID=A0A1B2AAK9_9SPHN|nr:long-chain-fatty-acid--CoA ligase [Tsuneonella dongtanensis]ANY19200.1 Long-chain-fatty-acid--CoA ligase [Tsuneonella dongtanensis]
MEFEDKSRVLGEALAQWAATMPHEIALRHGDATIDWETYDRHVTQIANGLAAMGLKKGDRVAYLGKNGARACELAMACARAGMIIVPVIWRLAPAEIEYILKDCDASALFVEPQFEAQPFDGPRTIMDDRFDQWRDSQADTAVTTPVDRGDVFLMLYTSGTTGMPKGVMLTHRNATVLRPIVQETGLGWFTSEPGDALIHAMPFGHIAGIGSVTGALNAGQHLIIHTEFDPALIIRDIQRYNAKQAFLVPAALAMMLDHPDAKDADFSNLQGMGYGASPIPLDLLKRGVERLQCDFAQMYGMTETYGTVVCLGPEDHGPGKERVMRAAGKALPSVGLRILDEEGNALPPGAIGEVAINSPTNMAGYWNKPDETARVLSADNWLRTGDAGILDEDGYLFIQDRIKDMIISGGENVYPAEVESALYGHPDIADVAVIGVPDERWGEAVKAVVVRRPGATLDADGVVSWAREKIAGFKCPKTVDFVDFLPRNPSGKILRRELRAPYWEGRERQVN